MAEIELAKDLTYEEKPFRILDEIERVARSKVIKFIRFSGSITPWKKQLGKERNF